MEKIKEGQRARSSSTGTIPELLKRKRESNELHSGEKEVERQQAFKKNHKINRTPPKEKIRTEDMDEDMKELKTMLCGLTKVVESGNEKLSQQIAKCESSNKEMKDEMRSFTEAIRDEIAKKSEEWKTEREALKTEINSLNEKMHELEVKLERKMEEDGREKRRQNIVIKGDTKVLTDGISIQKNVEELCQKTLGITIQTESAYVRTIRKGNDGKVVIVKMKSMTDKMLVMKSKSKLKNFPNKLFIDDDLAPEERIRRKEMKEWQKEKRAKGEEVKVGFDKVQIKGNWYKWKEIKQKSQE